MLERDVDGGVVLERGMHGEDVGVAEGGVDADLAPDLVKVERAQLGLAVHLERHRGVSGAVARLVDAACVATANQAVNGKAGQVPAGGAAKRWKAANVTP